MRTMRNRTATALGVLALASSGVTGVAVSESAQAANDRNGKCEKGEFCYNYNSNLKGSWSDFKKSEDNYGTDKATCYEFRGKGKGKSKCIKNDAGGYWNRTGKTVRVYFNSDFGGKSAKLKSGSKGKLPASVYNDNASHRIGGGGGPAPSGKWASPAPSSAVITAGYPNYPSGGYHGAVDYSGFNGKFSSACNGKIDKVDIDPTYPNKNAYGVSGSTNYLWVNCGGGIRMGYAHFYAKDKPASLKVGKSVKAGQDLVRVGNQGNSSGKHLHFEVRKGGNPIDGHKFLKSKGVKGLPSGTS